MSVHLDHKQPMVKDKSKQNVQRLSTVERITTYWNKAASVFGDPARAKPLLLIGVISILITLLSIIYLFINIPKNNALTRDIGALSLLSQQISRYATEASVSGDKHAAYNLLQAQREFNAHLSDVHDIYGKTAEPIKTVDQLWGGIDNRVRLILSNQKTVNNLYDIGANIADVIPTVQTQYNNVVEGLIRNGAGSSQVSIAKNQVWLAERILRSINSVQIGDEATVASADHFSSDTELFGRYLNGQLEGDVDLGVQRISNPQLRESLTAIKQTYDHVIQRAASRVLVSSPQIILVRESSVHVFQAADQLLAALDDLSDSVSLRYNNVFPGLILLLGLATFTYVLIRLVALRYRIDIAHARQIQQENDRNQQAILRLLDELGDLADGDLTVNASVTEDFTGAIADSINYAIDQLRELVSKINDTSVKLADYSQTTQSVAMQLVDASRHQADEITSASAAISDMAQSIDQVSANATESAQVAKQSVDIAHNGADVVQRGIKGMNVIRDQIQETAKRIKRLGESSQEIGDIVSLINDIADQTNILALNAAIQASMAGESGRGFAVVADEVQRLAERSAAATKQIESLVKTIQRDTNEAVISMEQTTCEVVRGATLAKDAGIALQDVQQVSKTLADLIQSISHAALKQAKSAGQMSNTMSIIQDITTQTAKGTINTAKSVGDLANMAVELRESVAGFKLPDEKQ